MGKTPVHRYVDGTMYRSARGRQSETDAVVDLVSLRAKMAVVDLDGEPVSRETFLRCMMRELKIRGFQPNSRKQYLGVARSFLRWTGVEPHQAAREHVRQYLEYLVDSGCCTTTVGVHLAAIRALFDKFCFRDITLGLVTPRRRKRLPVVLSRDEIQRLLQAAVCQRDTLVLGLMYATGMRVSEVSAVRIGDIDFSRNVIAIRQGKGNADRMVVLPESFRVCLSELSRNRDGRAYLFPSEDGRKGRHLSSRTVQRIMERTSRLAGIRKQATPHSLRHSFATHSFENGCDIRRIQKALGHVRLETTTIYVNVASEGETRPIPSPLDANRNENASSAVVGEPDESGLAGVAPVGCLRIHCRQFEGELDTRVTIEVVRSGSPVYFTGIRVLEARQDFWTIAFPPEQQWEEPLRKLSRDQQDRFRDPRFYQRLQWNILDRLRTAGVVENAA